MDAAADVPVAVKKYYCYCDREKSFRTRKDVKLHKVRHMDWCHVCEKPSCILVVDHPDVIPRRHVHVSDVADLPHYPKG